MDIASSRAAGYGTSPLGQTGEENGQDPQEVKKLSSASLSLVKHVWENLPFNSKKEIAEKRPSILLEEDVHLEDNRELEESTLVETADEESEIDEFCILQNDDGFLRWLSLSDQQLFQDLKVLGDFDGQRALCVKRVKKKHGEKRLCFSRFKPSKSFPLSKNIPVEVYDYVLDLVWMLIPKVIKNIQRENVEFNLNVLIAVRKNIQVIKQGIDNLESPCKSEKEVPDLMKNIKMEKIKFYYEKLINQCELAFITGARDAASQGLGDLAVCYLKNSKDSFFKKESEVLHLGSVIQAAKDPYEILDKLLAWVSETYKDDLDMTNNLVTITERIKQESTLFEKIKIAWKEGDLKSIESDFPKIKYCSALVIEREEDRLQYCQLLVKLLHLALEKRNYLKAINLVKSLVETHRLLDKNEASEQVIEQIIERMDQEIKNRLKDLSTFSFDQARYLVTPAVRRTPDRTQVAFICKEQKEYRELAEAWSLFKKFYQDRFKILSFN